MKHLKNTMILIATLIAFLPAHAQNSANSAGAEANPGPGISGDANANTATDEYETKDAAQAQDSRRGTYKNTKKRNSIHNAQSANASDATRSTETGTTTPR